MPFQPATYGSDDDVARSGSAGPDRPADTLSARVGATGDLFGKAGRKHQERAHAVPMRAALLPNRSRQCAAASCLGARIVAWLTAALLPRPRGERDAGRF